MATRLKNIKSSAWLKCTAYFLAAICVFTATWNAVGALKTLSDYGIESTLFRERAEFIDTTYFRWEIASAIDDLHTVHLRNSWEEDGLSKYHTLEETKQAVLEKFSAFLTDTMETAVARSKAESGVYDSYENVTTADGEAYDWTQDERARAYYEGTHQTIIVEDFGVYLDLSTDMTEADVEELVEQLYKSQIAMAKRNFSENVAQATEQLHALVNFKYLIRHAETGEVFTNLPNVQTADAFFAQCGEEDWYFGYTTEAGLVRSSKSLLGNLEKEVTDFSSLSFFPKVEALCDEGYDVYVFVPMPLEAVEGDRLYEASVRFTQESAGIEQQILAAGIFTACALLLAAYLLFVTGYVRETAEVRLSPLDRLPPDLHFLLNGAVIGGVCFAAYEALYQIITGSTAAQYTLRGVPLLRLGIAILGVAGFSALLEWLTSVIKYNRAEKPYFKSTLCYRLLHGLLRISRKGFRILRNGWKRLRAWMQRLRRLIFYRFRHLTRKAWMFVTAYVGTHTMLCLLLALWIHDGGELLILIGCLCVVGINVITFTLLWKHLVSLDKIIDAAEKSKNGETPQDIGAAQMPEPLQSLARDLTFTQEEMQKAINEAVKGERMKTELITNVSHDLKTPLTSIISYVDLLKKCDITDAAAQKYIAVLDEKSIRLKRLIEDLVEASKASSGAVTLHKMRVDLYQLAVQAIGEMEDAFSANGLQIVLDETVEKPPVIDADSQKTWRIISNLLSNARKYSLSGSRVYVRVFEQGDFGVFEIKNVSQRALNIDPDELTQRFVRGDAARTEEGSGLGLSIAKDLCTLQGGLLKIQIDGDLFKVTVALPLATASTPAVGEGLAT